jgi:hypothetical protein
MIADLQANPARDVDTTGKLNLECSTADLAAVYAFPKRVAVCCRCAPEGEYCCQQSLKTGPTEDVDTSGTCCG